MAKISSVGEIIVLSLLGCFKIGLQFGGFVDTFGVGGFLGSTVCCMLTTPASQFEWELGGAFVETEDRIDLRDSWMSLS